MTIDIHSLPIHPLADLFPMMDVDSSSGLIANIDAKGIKRPIAVFHGMVLDGRNRRNACKILHQRGAPPSDDPRWNMANPFHEVLPDDTDPLDYVLSHNLHRRHLTVSQRAVVAANIVNWEIGINQSTAGSANLQTRKAAKSMSISERAVAAASRIKKREHEQLLKAVMAGTVSVHTGEALVKLGDEELNSILVQERKDIVAQANRIRAENKKHAGALGAALGNERNDHGPDDLNLYQSPWVAVDVLHQLELSQKPHLIWEPACGPGAIAQRVVALDHDVLASDVEDYSTSPDGEVNEFWESHHPVVTDFLKLEKQPFGSKRKIDMVATNPPFNRADEFVAQALKLAKKHKIKRVAMLLRIGFMAGCGGPRCASLDDWSPERVIVFSRRLPMMHREDFTGELGGSRLDCAWFIWTEGSHGFQVERVDWKKQLKLTDEQARAVKSGAGPEILGAG